MLAGNIEIQHWTKIGLTQVKRHSETEYEINQLTKFQLKPINQLKPIS